MAIRQNNLSLEEVGGLLVDIIRPVATTSVNIRGGTLLIKNVIINIAPTILDIESFYLTAGGNLTAGNYYKVFVFYNQATSVFNARFSANPGHPLIGGAFSDNTHTVGIQEIPIAFVIVQATTVTDISPISDASNIIDLRGTNNAVRNIEQVRTIDPTPLNKIPVANANGEFVPTDALNLSTLNTSGIVRVNNSLVATDASGDTGSFGTDGGVSIEKNLYVGTTATIGGVVRANSTTDATDSSGITGSVGTLGGVSIAKNLYVGKGVQEQSQITIGDNVTTFGHFNATTAAPTPLGVSWDLSTIDSTGLVGQFTSIAIDSNDKIHISYYGDVVNDLKYATNASGSFVISTLDSTGNVGEYTSIAIDSLDKVHISYYGDVVNDLKYATNASGSFVISTLDSTGDVGQHTSIAIDSLDKVHISYYDGGNGNLKYATNASGSFVISTLDSTGDVGQHTSIAIDSLDKVHISYYAVTGGDLKYATNASGSFVISTLDSTGDTGLFTSIAIDSLDKIHISYVENGSDLFYATNVSGPFVLSTIDSSAAMQYTSIAIDSNDKVHISYHDDTNNNLKYATDISGTFETTTVHTTSNIGEYTSIKLDSTSKVYISYYNSSVDDLLLASRNAYGPNLSIPLNSAITAIGSGGKIYIKRGNYILGTTVDIAGTSESNISIVGEGSGTNIVVGASTSRLRVGNASTTTRVSVSEIRFTSGVGSVGTTNPMVELVNATSSDCMVNKCWFVGSGNPDVDITFTQANGHLVTDCRSTTATTNLP